MLALGDVNRSVGDAPIGLALGPPAEERVAIEEQQPAVFDLGGRELIVPGGLRRGGLRGGSAVFDMIANVSSASRAALAAAPR